MKRFSRKLLQCPNHKVPKKMLFQILYWALDHLNKTAVDNAADGSLVKLSYSVASTLLEEVTKKNRGWHTQETEVAKGSLITSYVDKE